MAELNVSELKKLILTHGEVMVLKQAAETTYDPITGSEVVVAPAVDSSVYAVKAPYKIYHIDGTRIKAGDTKIYMYPSDVDGNALTPTTSNHVEIDGQQWEIINVETLRYKGTIAAYTLQGRRG